jgi:hypothetical protein
MRKLRRARQKHIRKHEKLRQKALKAGTAAAVTFGIGISCSKAVADYVPDPHQLQVTKDADSDFLTNREEIALGYEVFSVDQNRNEIPDGIELAGLCAADISELTFGPDPVDPNKTYIDHWPALGLEVCDICGHVVNMGPAWIVNPRLGIRVECPLICMHYMEHGSFSYAGDVHNGRVNIPALLRALERQYPCQKDNHQVPLDYEVESVRIAPDANDYDGDFLADSEELAMKLNLYNSDQDGNLNPDGVELAKQCLAVFNDLPDISQAGPNEVYTEFVYALGLETCEICGEQVNMGMASVTNPKLQLTVTFPILVLHYMEHGSFSCAGSEHRSRVDVAGLVKAMEIPNSCGQLGTIYLPGDHDRDCDVDLVDFSRIADTWLNSSNPNGTSDVKY